MVEARGEDLRRRKEAPLSVKVGASAAVTERSPARRESAEEQARMRDLRLPCLRHAKARDS
ncbi:MAG: hypothetical protein EA402_01265 [Planctomycetota bacterium]|nr:MAG: hypothetical protein EA402_01265 [Planctomycetota bacterium]